METKIVIDLEKYRTKGSKVFTGRERGQNIRFESNIDKLVEQYEIVEISIPENVMSVNPSFLEEFLYNVVKKFGNLEFYKKIKFISESKRYNIENDLNEAVERILRTSNALTK